MTPPGGTSAPASRRELPAAACPDTAPDPGNSATIEHLVEDPLAAGRPPEAACQTRLNRQSSRPKGRTGRGISSRVVTQMKNVASDIAIRDNPAIGFIPAGN